MAKNSRSSFLVILSSLGWPLIFGAASCFLFYALIFRGALNTPSMHRYFATHPVAFVLAGMFCVGLSALLMKLVNVLGQFGTLSSVRLAPIPEGGQPAAESGQLLDELEELPLRARGSYLANRLHEALDQVERSGSADTIGDELKYLSDLDASRQQESYALVRIITWATPMLGFLGTVVGITQALGDLATQQLGGDLQGAMKGLLSGLYVAFDTTALALSLSIVLMFLHFLADMIETTLLTRVDERAGEELIGRFQTLGGASDPHLASMQRIGEGVLQGVRGAVAEQANVWRESFDTSQSQWNQFYASSVEQVQSSLRSALSETMDTYQKRMLDTDQEAAARVEQRWEQWQTSLSDNARILQSQQAEMARQTEAMSKAFDATRDVIRLETALNDNLKQLAGASHFEDTVMSLSAAIHLLNMRLGADSRSADLASEQDRAA